MNTPSAEKVKPSYLVHELRAPVTAVRLGLELLHEQLTSRLGEDEKRLLSVSLKNTLRLEGLINDVMEYSKLMAGRLALNRKACEARGLVSEAVLSLGAWAAARGVKLVEAADSDLRAMAEPRRVVQVLTNLLSNAIKFTPSGKTVTVSAKADGRGSVVFAVEDEGCGIAEQDLERVFDSFAQAEAGRQKPDGTGLGLTLARLMVQLHGGRIWVQSKLGCGSRFCFTIPAAPPQASPRQAPLAALKERLAGLGSALKSPTTLLLPPLRRRLQVAAVALALWLGLPSRLGASEDKARRPRWDSPGAPQLLASDCFGLLRTFCSPPDPLSSRRFAWAGLKDRPPRFLSSGLLRLARAFLDDVQVAAKGNWTFRLRLELR